MDRTGTGAGRPAIILNLRRRFPAPPERVFAAWTQPKALRRWWCPPGWSPAEIAVDLREGGLWNIAMRHQADRRLVGVGGRFIAIDPARRLIYTWRWDGAFAGMPETRVTVTFTAVADGTDVVLIHEPMTDVAQWTQHRAGWLLGCDRMEALLLT